MLFGKYASKKSEAKYPSLHDQLAVAWCPAIQSPSGLTMYSHIGRANATLAGVDTATCWGRTNGKNALITDGVNDYASIRVPLSLPFTFTISGVFRSTGTFQNIVISAESTGFFALLINGSEMPYYYSGGNLFFPNVAMTFGAPATISAVVAVGRRELWVNGVRVGSDTNQTAMSGTLTGLFRLDPSWYYTRVDLFAASVHKRALTASELIRLNKEPEAIFAARRNVIGGSAVSVVSRRTLSNRIGSRSLN